MITITVKQLGGDSVHKSTGKLLFMRDSIRYVAIASDGDMF